MRHTAYSDYALRILMYLAAHPDRLCTVDEIAQAYGISRNHLMKLAFDLGKAGILKTHRGRNGGLALARPPEGINVGEVIRQTEEDFALVECFRPEGNVCALTATCRLRGIVARALNAYLQVLDGYTIADLVGEPQVLALLKQLRPGQVPSGQERAKAEAEVEAIAGVDPREPGRDVAPQTRRP